MAMLDNFLESLRAYAAQREGMSPAFVPMGPGGYWDALKRQQSAAGGESVPLPQPRPDMPSQSPIDTGGAPIGALASGGFLSGSGLLRAPGGGAVPAGDAVVAESPPADLPPSTNDPTSNEPQVFANGVPLPRPRPVSPASTGAAPLSMAAEPDTSPIPPKATLTGPAVAAPGGDGIGGILSKIFKPENAGLFMALGAGFSGAPSFGTGMRRAAMAAGPAIAATRADQIKQNSIAATYRALVAKGVPAAEALAAVYNPDVMKATAAKYFETKPLEVKMQTDEFGAQHPVVFNPNTGKFQDQNGQPIGGGSPTASGFLAKGVTAVNHDLIGNDYLNQYSPEVQQAVKDYVAGRTTPTGNPRKGFTQQVKMIASKYGSDIGVPADDASFAQRKKYRIEIASNSANTAGGQAKAFTQGIEHADALAKKLEQLGNVDPVGIPSVAHGLNWMRQTFSSKQTAVAKEAASIGQTLAGEVGKLFSGAAGGGVHERELTRQRFNTVTTPAELAGALDATLETMEGGLRALEGRRDEVLGPGNNVTFVTKDTQDKIERIRGTIRRLRGEEGAPPAPAQMPRLKPGASTVINGVTIKRLN